MDFKTDIFHQPKNQSEPRAGSLLVASPLLREPYFRESVVLILEKDINMGYIGLTLNMPTKLTLADLIGKESGGDNIRVFGGGPVDEERLFMLHSIGEQIGGVRQIIPGLYVGGELEMLASYLKDNNYIEGTMRYYLGYSGWTGGQLETEIASGFWGVLNDYHFNILQGEGKEYWQRAVMTLGADFRNWLLMPDDPRNN